MEEEHRTWPELVGKTVDEATAVIRSVNPDYDVVPTPENSPITMDYRIERVRVFHDSNGIVTKAPYTA